MVVAMTKVEASQQQTDATKEIKRLNLILLLVFVVILAVPAIGAWWVSRQLPVVNTVDIENVNIVGESILCPGQPLITSYDFHAQGAGVLIRDWTLYNIDPPRTLIYSMSRRFILDGPVDQHLRETWHVPPTYLNYETENFEPLPPGKYRRFMAISSPSRSSVIDIVHVDFTISEECP